MKKIIAVILSAFMMFAIVGCDNDDKKSDRKSETTLEETTEETTEATTEETTEETTEATTEATTDDTEEAVADLTDDLFGDFGSGEVNLSETGMAIYEPLSEAGFLVESFPAEDMLSSDYVVNEGFFAMSQSFDQIVFYFQLADKDSLDGAYSEFVSAMDSELEDPEVAPTMDTVMRNGIEFHTVEIEGQVAYFCKDVKTNSIFVVTAPDAATAESILEIVGY